MKIRAFTLIELLVVISIVALLSSVVLASLNSARDKASIGAGKQFEGNVYHIAGDRAAGIWDFDECSGTTAADRSGNKINGTLAASASNYWSTDTPYNSGCSLSLNGTDQYVDYGNPAGLQFTGSSQFTISVWVNPTTCVYPSSVFDKFGARGYRLYIEATCQPSLQIRDSSSAISQVFSSMAVPTSKWSFVTMVFDAGKVTFYINGKLSGSGTLGVTLADLNGNAYTGRAPNNPGTYFQGKIDNIKVFAAVLTASEIQNLYASESFGAKIVKE